jgi:hypothetical protein
MKPLLLLCALLLPAFAWAGSRSSANYRVTTDTLDDGGRRATSAAYRNDGSIGGIGGVGTAPAPVSTAKHSYIGQLYEASSLVLSATPSPVNEGNAAQLGLFALLDDATRLVPPPATVLWNVVAGPIASITPGGLATAAAVYQNTAATVGGRFLGLSNGLDVLVLNVLPDNFGTYAGDGIDDAWQVQYFGIGNANACPLCDPDLDLQNNRFEYVAGTIPTDFNSRFRFRIEAVPGISTNQDLVFSPRFPSRTYWAEFRTSADAGLFVPVPVTATSDAGSERTITDLQATDPARFYRIGITYP